ncbi:hypothetical protein D3C80_1698650 [compost metagenome]
MVIAKLGAVTFIENKHNAFVAQWCQQLFVGGLVVAFALLVAFAVFIQGETELLYGGDDHFIGVVLG